MKQTRHAWLDTPAADSIIADLWSGRPQHWRAPFPIGRDGEGEITLGYRRCRSADPSGSPGQDFAAACYDTAHVIGVVADGVGQSFHGEIAARMVGERLLSALWERRHQPPGEREMAELLLQWVPDVDSEVAAIPIPKGLPYIEEAEREAKLQGSQTVFSAFLLETVNGRLDLYQVGDAPAWIDPAGRQPEIILAPERGRWSSTGKADLQLRVLVRTGVQGCLIHSDGLGQAWTEEILSQGNSFASFAEAQCERDDLCFVQVQRLREPSATPSGLPFEEKESPEDVREPSVEKAPVIVSRRAPRTSGPPLSGPSPNKGHAETRHRRKADRKAPRYAAAVLCGFLLGWLLTKTEPAPPSTPLFSPLSALSSPKPADPPPPVQPAMEEVSFPFGPKSLGPLLAGNLAILLDWKNSSTDSVELWVGGKLTAKVFPGEAVHPSLMLRGLDAGKEIPVQVRVYKGERVLSQTLALTGSDGTTKNRGWYQLTLAQQDGP